MSIEIQVGNDVEQNETDIKMSLIARRTMDGNILILDHNDIDVAILPGEKKIITFPKASFHDGVYSTQERLFNYLSKKGVIKRETIQSGNVYGSIEAEYPDATEGDTTQIIMYTIGTFMNEEKPHLEMEEYLEDEWEKSLTEPDGKDSTELGEVPQVAKKGTIDPQRVRRYLPVWSESLIPLLNRPSITIKQLAKEYEEGIENWVYSIQDNTKEPVIGKVVWCGKNYTTIKLIKVHTNDGWVMTAPEHPFLTSNDKKNADELVVGDKLVMFINGIKTSFITITKVEVISSIEDVYCMNVVGINNEYDRHNFATLFLNDKMITNGYGCYVHNSGYGPY